MGRMRSISATATVLAAITFPAVSQNPITDQSRPPVAAAPPMSLAPNLSPAQRSAIAKDLIAKWQKTADKQPGGGGERWAGLLAQVVATADAANVKRATTATSLDLLYRTLSGYVHDVPVSSPGSLGSQTVTPQVLGSYLADTTYTPLPSGRCRIADSRVISSPLPAGGTRSLRTEFMSSYSSQGGNGTYTNGDGSTNCGLPGYPTAYALSITLLSPGGNGVFKAYRYAYPAATGNSILYNAGDYGASGDLIVQNCNGCSYNIAIQSSARTHYVIDVLGYFAPPQATPLYCYYTSWSQQTVANGGVADVYAPACAAGYNALDTICQSTSWVQYVHMGLGQCAALNNSGGNATVSAMRNCCRVPGR
jgi:hypothetical protein